MGIPDYLPASWEICVQVKKQQLKLDMKQQTGSTSEKEYVKAVCSGDKTLLPIQKYKFHDQFWQYMGELSH